jgi:hypothetical protein
MGGKLGTILAKAGHDVVFSYSRSEDTLERLASEAGSRARAGTPAEAAADADAVLRAVHSRLEDVLTQASSPSLTSRNRERRSRVEFRQLVEMGVVVRNFETVNPGARKDEKIRKGNDHAGCAGTVSESNRPLPDLNRDLVVG